METRINPWEHPLAINVGWKTKSNYFTWLRGGIRKIWQDNPLRKEWKKSKLRQITEEEKKTKKFHSSTKNIGMCYRCEEWFPGSKLECDHLEEAGSCTSFEEAEEFLWSCASDNPDNWGLICKPCHKIKSYATKQSVSFEEAEATKLAISLIADKKDKDWLISKGIKPASNQKARREQIINEVMEWET